VDATPVWFMRQAGGRLPSYLALRERHSVLEIAHTPDLCAEVSAGAATALGTDAAVMYADIMLLAEALGVELELTSDGPVVTAPLRSVEHIAALRSPDARSDLGFVLEAIAQVRKTLGDTTAIIGVAGGPFTMAAYLIEGGPSRDRLAARTLMHQAPDVWTALLDRITDATVDYVGAQVRAGADAVQVFDSWAGVLAPDDYRRYVAPASARILAAITAAGGIAIHFLAAGAGLLELIADGATVVSVDAGQSFASARARLGAVPLQGNLDPARVAAGWRTASEGIDIVLAANAGRAGHVFNTGHALPPGVNPDLVRDVVDAVHQRTARAPFLALRGDLA
jgi:uroporphyrinogen decarboxylase